MRDRLRRQRGSVRPARQENKNSIEKSRRGSDKVDMAGERAGKRAAISRQAEETKWTCQGRDSELTMPDTTVF